MRTLIILLCIMALGCHHPTSAPAVNLTFVPIWRADTMMNGYRIQPTDTMYAYLSGDTSCILYHDTVLYVFGYDFDTTKTSCRTVWIGATPLDTNAAYSKCIISYYRWYDAGDQKSKQATQMISISTRYPHFSTTGDSYYFGR